ncbi:MAG: 2-phospho-L-lactate transferase [Burkholderiaceae bacterium]|nr:2-phospho-L-lactate transferase [Burkholderiaceae bacterium]
MSGTVLALSGGVGGAKLALGLSRVLAPGTLTVVANTGDDFRHLGLAVSPDVDTLVYTLAGLADPQRGWGRRDESWHFMDALESLGGETWFRIGDADLAMHVERTHRLAAGHTLGQVTHAVVSRLGIAARIVPMSDDAVATRLRTDDGWLDFQDYFVRRRCAPAVRAVAYAGADIARPAEALREGLAGASLRAVIVCPSNPLLSVEPMLALPGVRDALAACPAPVVAVSPVIAGQAVKGPTVKLMRDLGLPASAAGVARRYAGLIDALLVDAADAEAVAEVGIEPVIARILMDDLEQREALARTVLATAAQLATLPVAERLATRTAAGRHGARP